jgi:hypothetical protein
MYFIHGILKVTSKDLDEVMCLLCGKCPKMINSDGNAKDSIQVAPNLKFDYKDMSDPPALADFQTELILHLFKTAFWQNEPQLSVNMLKLPIIMAPGLLGKQVNNDVKKDSLLDKSVQHSSATFREFTKMIDNKGKTLYNIYAMCKK